MLLMYNPFEKSLCLIQKKQMYSEPIIQLIYKIITMNNTHVEFAAGVIQISSQID